MKHLVLHLDGNLLSHVLRFQHLLIVSSLRVKNEVVGAIVEGFSVTIIHRLQNFEAELRVAWLVQHCC